MFLETKLDYLSLLCSENIYKSMAKNAKIIGVFIWAFKEAELNCVNTNIL
jgi:hypothetical protein